MKQLLLLIAFLLLPINAFALSDTDQQCNSLGTNYSFIGSNHEIFQIFVPETDILDAVSIRVKTEIGTSSNLLVEVYNATNAPIQKIAEGSKTLGNTTEWVLIDFEDVETPLGMYAIKARTTDQNAHGIWYYSGNSCYERGYASLDEEPRLDLDMNFVTYGYNQTAAAPPASNNTPQAVNTPAPNPGASNPDSSDSSSAPNPDDTVSQSASSTAPPKTSAAKKAASTVTPITKEEAERIARELSRQDDSGNMLAFLLGRAIVPLILLGFLFLLGVLGLVLLILSRKKKQVLANKSEPLNSTHSEVKSSAPQKAVHKPSRNGNKVLLILLVIIILLAIVLLGGLFAYKKIKSNRSSSLKPSSSSPVALISTVATGSAGLSEENEFAPVLKPIVGEITLKYNTAILGGKHIFYVPARDITNADYDKIKSALIAKGYQEFKDSSFNGEKSLTFIKDNNFIRIPKKTKFISIAVVEKKEDLKNKI